MTNKAMPKGHVNNGARPVVSLPEFEGAAGYVQRSATSAQLAFMPNRRGGTSIPGDVIEVDGRSWRVAGRESSAYVSGMVVLRLETAA